VSANRFFDAPSQAPECQSFGVQTSPGDFLTTVVAPLTSGATAIDPTPWNNSTLGYQPAVAIYRQRLLADESACSGAICNSDATWSCQSGSFLMGAQNGQAPYLTANGGVYYIDTDSSEQSSACISGAGFGIAPFGSTTNATSYVVYQLFAQDDSKVTYQFYTGESGDSPSGYWVWVQPHVYLSGEPNTIAISTIPDPLQDQLNANVSLRSGVVEATFDSSLFAAEFAFTLRNQDEKCIPRDVCSVGSAGEQCVLADDFVEPGLTDTMRSICETWATRVAGTTPIDPLSLSDCPATGCLGYVFTLAQDFTGSPYATSGAPLVTCFPEDALWNRPLQVISQDMDVCTMPPAPAGFCSGPMPTPTWTTD
jgi:hypothetical protein